MLPSVQRTPRAIRSRPRTSASVLYPTAIARFRLALLDRAVEEIAAEHDQEHRPVALQAREVEPAEVVGEQDDADRHERPAPDRRLDVVGLVLRDAAPERARVDGRGALVRVDEVVEVDEGDEEREG